MALSEGFTGAELKIACKEASMMQIRIALKQKHVSTHTVAPVNFDALQSAIKQIQPAMLTIAEKHREWNNKHGNKSL